MNVNHVIEISICLPPLKKIIEIPKINLMYQLFRRMNFEIPTTNTPKEFRKSISNLVRLVTKSN